MALIFPANPSVGDLYPVNPGTSGVTQYRWDGEKWIAALSTVSLGSPNQGAYNNYTWPQLPGVTGQSLILGNNGLLTWGGVSLPITLSQAFLPFVPTVGVVVTYRPGVASGGSGGYTYAYQWLADGDPIPGATSVSYTPVIGDVGKVLSVTQTAFDSALSVTNQTTTAPGPVPPPTFPLSVWDPTPTDGLELTNGVISGAYNGTSTTITASGCIEISLNNGAFFSGSLPISPGDELTARWISSISCGDAPTGTEISGSVTDGSYRNEYNLVINRIPNPALSDISTTNVFLSQTSIAAVLPVVAGLTGPAEVTYFPSSTGGQISASKDGVNFTVLSTLPGRFTVENGDRLFISQVAAPTVATASTAIIRVGDGTGNPGTFDEFTFTANTVNTAAFPNTTFLPGNGPTASPSTVSIPTEGLYGISRATWADGTTTLVSTGAIRFRVNSGAFDTGPAQVQDGDIVELIWEPTQAKNASNNTTLTGTLSAGIYSNNFSLTVDKDTTQFQFMNVTGAALNGLVTSNTITPKGFNVPINFSRGGPSSSSLSTVEASINGGAFITLSGGLEVNPGETIAVRGITGPDSSTVYDVRLFLTNINRYTWEVTTTAAAASIAQPMIASPVDGSINVNPILEVPGGISLIGTPYEPLNGAGAQSRADWDVYKGGFPLTGSSPVTGVSTTPGGQFSQITRLVTSLEGEARVIGAPAAGGVLSLYARYRFQVGTGFTPALYYSFDKGVTWQTVPNSSASSTLEYWNFATSTNGRIIWGEAGNGVTYILSSDGTAIIGGTDTGGRKYGLATDNDFTWVTGGFSPYSCARSRDNGDSFVTILLLPTGLPTTPVSPVWDASNSKFLLIGNGVCLQATTGISYTPTASAPTMTADAGYAAYYNGTILIGEDQADGKLFRSTNGGDTWTTIDTGIPGARFARDCFTSDGNGNWWCAFKGTTSIGFSGDDGLTWTEIPMGNPRVSDVLSVQYFEGSVVVAGQIDFSEPATILEEAPIAGTTLQIANAAAQGFRIGLVVKGSTSGATGEILSLSDTQVVVSLTGTTQFSVGDTLSVDPTSYSFVPGFPKTVTSTFVDKTKTLIPIADLETTTTYYARVRYSTTNSLPATSDPSPWVQFTTTNDFVIPPGTFIFGGGYAGQLLISGKVYNIIACPRNQFSPELPIALNNARPTVETNNGGYGGLQTWNNATPDFPWYDYVTNNPLGPNAGVVDITNDTGTGTSGYNDWYLASDAEAKNIYYYLKPTTQQNSTFGNSGANGFRVPPYPNNFSALDPLQTEAPEWQEGGTFAFNPALNWSSSYFDFSGGQFAALAFTNGVTSRYGALDGGVSNLFFPGVICRRQEA